MVNKIESELAKRTFGKHFSALVGNQHASERRNLASVVNPKVDSIFAAQLEPVKADVVFASAYLTP
jgi:hypothetical protein